MSKKKKKDVHMIDMSARLNVKVVSATQEETIALQHELDEIEISVAKRMELYEKNLKNIISSVINEGLNSQTEKDSMYFIEKYEDYIENRNHNNIKNRLEQYKLYIEEQDD